MGLGRCVVGMMVVVVVVVGKLCRFGGFPFCLLLPVIRWVRVGGLLIVGALMCGRRV